MLQLRTVGVAGVDPESNALPHHISSVVNEKKNGASSRLYRIPEEILAMIIDYLKTDIVSSLCVGQVSLRLRQIVYDKSFPISPGFLSFERDPSRRLLESLAYQYQKLSKMDRLNLRKLLRKDRLCQPCLRHTELISSDDPAAPSSDVFEDGCKFRSGNYLYCDACDHYHSSREFCKDQKNKFGDKVCIGRKGGIRLCGHRLIQWADLELCFLQRINQQGIDGFISPSLELVCSHPVHKSSDFCDDYWKPKLEVTSRAGMFGHFMFHINRSWATSHTLPLNDLGRLNSRDVLSALERDQNTGPVKAVISGARGNAGLYQAMSCFGSPSCQCLTYDDGDTNLITSSKSQQSETDWVKCGASHTLDIPVDIEVQETGSESIHIIPLRAPDLQHNTKPQVRLTIRYRNAVVFSKHQTNEGPLDKLVPPHRWLHAMDPDSYKLDDDTQWSRFGHGPLKAERFWPICRDPSCGRNYATYQATSCPDALKK